jgi:Flp pilus assembly protein CpaB
VGEARVLRVGSPGRSTLDAEVDGQPRAASGPPVLVGRRRALPTGRALAGGFLVAVAAVIVFAALLTSTGNHNQSYAVANQPIPAGSTIGPADLSTARMSLPGPAGGRAFRDVGSLVGRTAAAAIGPGELIEASMLVPVGSQPATRPVSVGVEPSSLAGLASGSSVDVLETAGTGTAAAVSVVMRGAVLVAVSNPASSALATSSTLTVTLGVQTLSEVEAIVQAAQSGTVSLVTAEPSDGVGAGPGAPAGPG